MTAPLFTAAAWGEEEATEPDEEPLGLANERMEADPSAVDPLKRLFDPSFTEVSWEYEGSRLDSPMLPGKLHAKQLEVLYAKQRFKWLFWGNQVGKTTEGAIELVLHGLGRHPLQRWAPGLALWASALTWELWQDILLPELLTWIPADRLVRAPEPYRMSTNRTIVFRADNGKLSRITGKAAEQGAARYQSKRLHGIWMDEEHPEAVFDEVQPRLLRFGGFLINTMTPLKGLTYVYHRIYQPVMVKADKAMQADNFVSHAGLADNPSITEEARAALRRALAHNPAQLAAREHGVFVKPSGLVLKFDEAKHTVPLSHAEVERILQQRRCRVFGGTDFGAHRFAFVLIIVDETGKLYLIDELFIQGGQYRDVVDRDERGREVIRERGRARKIHELLVGWQVPAHQFLGIGDCANPQDIIELNSAMIAIESPYRFGAVHANNKIISAGVMRVQGLLGSGNLVVRRGLGAVVGAVDPKEDEEQRVWYVGRKSDSDGHPVEGSRWIWEANNWLYPKGEVDKAQKDLPNDDSADGADMMAATRYVVMTFSAGDGPEKPRTHPTAQQIEAAWQRGEELPALEPEFNENDEFSDTINEG